jgi:hypothetical protein
MLDFMRGSLREARVDSGTALERAEGRTEMREGWVRRERAMGMWLWVALVGKTPSVGVRGALWWPLEASETDWVVWGREELGVEKGSGARDEAVVGRVSLPEP